MKFLVITFLILGPIGTNQMMAGPGSGHSHHKIKSTSAEKLASKQLTKLINKGKIEKSWAGMKPNKPYKKDYGKGPEWVVTFDNPKASDEKKKKLYIFISLDGHVLASNFTGK